MRALWTLPLAVLLQGTPQDKLRRDIEDRLPGERWIWNDWSTAHARAKKTGKPIFALFRCVP